MAEQRTEEWKGDRLGVITGTKAHELLSSKTTRLTLMARMLSEFATANTKEIPQTFAMKRGQEQEVFARQIYEEKHDVEVVESGIAISNCTYFGYSTDGFVGTDGAVEIKSLVSPKTILPVLSGDLSDYMDQCQGGLWITEREWIDFIMYLPQLKSIKKDMYIQRVYRDEAYIKQLKSDLDQFNDHIWSIINQLAA